MLKNKRILLTGGTGSLGGQLLERILKLEDLPKCITIFSRDEEKQYFLKHRLTREYPEKCELVRFVIGDVRNLDSIKAALIDQDVVFNVAALKQVPSCENFPFEAVQTNIIGPQNIITAIKQNRLSVQTVIGISTDKACKPVSAMGMTKALQEKLYLAANLDSNTKFVVVRYGNVINSRGSVIPLFKEQAKHGGPLTITDNSMTRFLMTLDQSVDIVFKALELADPGDIFIPKVPAGLILDVAKIFSEKHGINIVTTGIRPGEKIHEILISEEEIYRTIDYNDHYVIKTSLLDKNISNGISQEYSSKDNIIDKLEIESILHKQGLI